MLNALEKALMDRANVKHFPPRPGDTWHWSSGAAWVATKLNKPNLGFAVRTLGMKTSGTMASTKCNSRMDTSSAPCEADLKMRIVKGGFEIVPHLWRPALKKTRLALKLRREDGHY